MTTKNCVKCGLVFEYTPVVGRPDNRKYCDPCSKLKKAEYEASQNRPVEQNAPVNAPVVKPGILAPDSQEREQPNRIAKENGNFQSTVWTHAVAANSYEVGKVGDRFKLYFETPQELQGKIAELKALGFMKDEFKPLEP